MLMSVSGTSWGPLGRAIRRKALPVPGPGTVKLTTTPSCTWKFLSENLRVGRVFEVFLIVLDGVQGETLWGGQSVFVGMVESEVG